MFSDKMLLSTGLLRGALGAGGLGVGVPERGVGQTTGGGPGAGLGIGGVPGSGVATGGGPDGFGPGSAGGMNSILTNRLLNILCTYT